MFLCRGCLSWDSTVMANAATSTATDNNRIANALPE